MEDEEDYRGGFNCYEDDYGDDDDADFNPGLKLV